MLGNKIKKLRLQKKLSLRELSEKIDISISFLSDIENNRSRPSLERLIDLSKGLETSVAYLVGEENTVATHPVFNRFQNNPNFQKLLEEFKDFDEWSTEEIEEIITYLQVKRKMRK